MSKEREERAKQKIEGMNSKIKVLESNLQQFQAKSAGQSNAINDLKEKKDLLTKGTPLLMQKKINSMMRWPK